MKRTATQLLITFLLAVLIRPAHAARPAGTQPPTGEQIQVTVEGLEKAALQNVLSSLSMEKRKEDSHLTEGLIRRLHAKADGEIRRALQPLGYYHPSIAKELHREQDVWHARYRVDPGEPVKIARIDLEISGEGAAAPALNAFVQDFPLKEGDHFDHGAYESTKQRLQRLALHLGYLDAVLGLHRVEVDPEENTAVIHLHMETGPQYRFGPVTFSGSGLNDRFLQRYAKFRRGDPYSQQALFKLQNALHDSSYFSSVEVVPRRDRTRGLEVPVEVILKPRPLRQYSLGVGYGTDTGARASLGWENRRINRRGHRADAELKVSEVRDSVTARYMVPLGKPLTDYLDYTGGWSREHTDTSRSETFLFGTGYHHLRSSWNEAISLNYRQEKFTVSDETGRSNLLLPGISWTRVTTDDRIYTRSGSRLLLEVRGAHQAVFSDTTLIQLRSMAKFIHGLGDSGRIIVRGEAGTSLVDRFSEIPASLRFFAGGDQSIRGYAYRSLGPTDDQGEVIGGRRLLVGSVEYEHRLPGKWSAAVFYDAGNAINSLSDPYKEGAGFGIRRLSPVGLIRLDLASALSDPGRPWRIHLTIGPDL